MYFMYFSLHLTFMSYLNCKMIPLCITSIPKRDDGFAATLIEKGNL